MKSIFKNNHRLRRIAFFFPIQLLLVQFKKNLLLMLFWLLLFAIISKIAALKYGIPFLFLNPEYLNEVNFLSYFIVGFALGGFIIAFQISSYIMNGFRFPFLATLSNPFFKFCLNNSILPLFFIGYYCVSIFSFQRLVQFVSVGDACVDILGFLGGLVLFLSVALSYFFRTNKNIYKMFGVKTQEQSDDHKPKKTSRIILRKNMEWKSLQVKEDRDWHIETYINSFTRIKLARNVDHYEKEMLKAVFKQNHRNAAIFELVVFVSLILLGLFRENKLFEIPAGASLLLLFTMYLMLTSAIHNWLRGWSSTVLIMFLFLISALFASNFFNSKSGAYGLNYMGEKAGYTYQNLASYNSDSTLQNSDIRHTLEILEKWKAKNTTSDSLHKPKLIIVNTSGGGLRSALWTMLSLTYADSVSGGKLLKQTQLISGASGGMIGAAYLRELYLRYVNKQIQTYADKEYAKNISIDMLNPITMSIATNDMFLRLRSTTINNNVFKKDRGYAFEQKLNENTQNVLNKKLIDYRVSENEAHIPMMIFTPIIANDGRKMVVCSQLASYITSTAVSEKCSNKFLIDGVEFSRFFSQQDADSVRFSSVLRMSATFPYITPFVALPSEPVIEVLDAGGRDNYGMETSIRFLFVFKKWIEENTSGVVFVQIRDRHKERPIEKNPNKTLIQSFTAPINSLYGNMFQVQDYNQNELIRYANSWFKGNLDVVDFQLFNEVNDNISLSWHLTNLEKQKVYRSIFIKENQASFKRLKKLLE